MALEQKKSVLKKTSTNKVGKLTLTYDYDIAEDGTVKSIHARGDEQYRISAWYDPGTSGITIGISDIGKDFSAKIFSVIAEDMLKILKNK